MSPSQSSVLNSPQAARFVQKLAPEIPTAEPRLLLPLAQRARSQALADCVFNKELRALAAVGRVCPRGGNSNVTWFTKSSGKCHKNTTCKLSRDLTAVILQGSTRLGSIGWLKLDLLWTAEGLEFRSFVIYGICKAGVDVLIVEKADERPKMQWAWRGELPAGSQCRFGFLGRGKTLNAQHYLPVHHMYEWILSTSTCTSKSAPPALSGAHVPNSNACALHEHMSLHEQSREIPVRF